MTTLLNYVAPGSSGSPVSPSSLPSSFVLESGPALSNDGVGHIVSVDPTAQSKARIDIASTTSSLPNVMQVDGYFPGAPFDLMLSLGRQAGGDEYAAYLNAGGAVQFYKVNGSSFTAIGSASTAAVFGSSGWLRMQFTWAASGVLTCTVYYGSTAAELGSGPSLVISAFTRTDTSGTAGAPAITATTGKAALLVKNVQVTTVQFSDAAASGPTVSAPSNATVTTPTTATFTTSITGSYDSIQWEQSTDNGATWASVPDGTGGTTASYTTSATAVSSGAHRNGYQYRPAVAWSGGTVYGAAATLTVNASGTAPSITSQPQSTSVQVGSTATFSVTATGTSLTYQWRKNGSNISGATSATYTTPAVVSGDNGALFSVVVAGAMSPAATSSNATLTVTTTSDTTAPTLTGAVTASAVGSTTATLSWPAGADNVGVAGYEYALNGGGYVSVGNALTASLTGLTANTAYSATVRAFDLAGNRSTPAIVGTFTTATAAPPPAGTNMAGPFFNNTLNEPYRGVSVTYSWWAGAGQRIGNLTVAPVQGTGTLDDNGYFSPTSGRGLLMVSIPRTDARDDDVYYQAF